MDYKKDWINFMVDSGALKFGNFTLKSGRKSPFFMNAGSFTNGDALQRLGKFYAQKIHDVYGTDFDVLFGPAYKGIPLAVSTAIAFYELFGKKVLYTCNRKEAKDHGADAGAILGHKIVDGERVVIVEDVTTSGASIKEVLPIIKAIAPASTILGEVVMLDRMERAPDSPESAATMIEKEYGFPVHPIVSMEEVVSVLMLSKGMISPAIRAALVEYYKEWGAMSASNLITALQR